MNIRTNRKGYVIRCSEQEFGRLRGGCSIARNHFSRNVVSLVFAGGLSLGPVEAANLSDCQREAEQYSALIDDMDEALARSDAL